MDKLWYLSQINVFQDLPRSDLKVIGEMAPMSSIDKGTIISSPMDDRKVLYLLKKDRVRLIIRARRRRVLINMEKARSFLDREEAS